MHPRAVRARQARPGAEHVAVMGGAYHGHTRVLIDMSPFKFEGAGGEGRQAWVHVLPCPDPYRRAPLPKRQTRRRRVCCHTSAPSSWCGVKQVHKRITYIWQHCGGHLPPDPFMLSPLAACWAAAARAEIQPLPYQAGTAPAPPCSLWLQRRPPGGDSGAATGRGLHLDGRAAAAAAIAEAEAAGGRICAFFAESILSCGGQARARVFSGSLPGAPPRCAVRQTAMEQQ